MFTLTEFEDGHTYTIAEFETLDDAKFALDQLYLALDDCRGSGYSLRCAIAELSQQISAAECPPD